MAIDTRQKRQALAGIGFYANVGASTATQNQAWRQAAGWGYPGILADGAAPSTGDWMMTTNRMLTGAGLWLLLVFFVAGAVPASAQETAPEAQRIAALEAQVKNLQATVQQWSQRPAPPSQAAVATSAKQVMKRLKAEEPWCHDAGGTWIVRFEKSGKVQTVLCEIRSRR